MQVPVRSLLLTGLPRRWLPCCSQNLKLPPALCELECFIFHPLSAKLAVTDSFYNGLVAQTDALKEIIEPSSHSGADMLAGFVVAALHPEFEGGDEIVLAGKAFRYLHVQYNTRRPTAGMLAECDLFAGQVDTLLYQIWKCMSKFDMDHPFTLSRKRSRADESATLKLKRPDLCITTSRALLFKGEDKTSDADLRKAIEELGTKMSNWGANFRGKVCCHMLLPNSICSAPWLRYPVAFCFRLITCCAMPVLAQSSSYVSCRGEATFLERWALRCPWVHKLAGCASLQWLYKCIRSSKLKVHTSLITTFHWVGQITHLSALSNSLMAMSRCVAKDGCTHVCSHES